MAGIALATTLMFGLFGKGPEKPKGPDPFTRLAAVVRLQGRFASGHACPVSPTQALTNAHMVDYRRADVIQGAEDTLPINPIPYRFESLDGLSIGTTKTQAISFQEDLAIITGDFKEFYPLAETCPIPGERVINLAYANGSKRGTILPTAVESKVLASVAGKVEYDNSGSFGSSGSCVLNEKGEVVAINSQVLLFDDGKMHGEGVLVCGGWRPSEFIPQK